jgi:hypothetical protein
MTDSIETLSARARLAHGRIMPTTLTTPATAPLAAETDEDQCPAFGYLRGIRDRALTLEFRLANGNSISYPYQWLCPVQYDRSAGLLLKFTGDLIYLVLIEGSNLNVLVNNSVNLYDRGINRHRISWVREMTRQQVQQAREGEIIIDRIRMVSYRHDQEPGDVEWLKPFQSKP